MVTQVIDESEHSSKQAAHPGSPDPEAVFPIGTDRWTNRMSRRLPDL
jgi:hypothetical protein